MSAAPLSAEYNGGGEEIPPLGKVEPLDTSLLSSPAKFQALGAYQDDSAGPVQGFQESIETEHVNKSSRKRWLTVRRMG